MADPQAGSIQADVSGGVGSPRPLDGIQTDQRVGVGLSDAARKATIQADFNIGVGLTDTARKASIQADVSPKFVDAFIQADVNVAVLYSGGSGNMPIGPRLRPRRS